MDEDVRTGKSTLIVPSNSYNLTDLQGKLGTAALISATYDPVAHTITPVSFEPSNQYIQDIAVSNSGRIVVTIGDCAFSGEKSFSRICKLAYNNGAPAPNDEIRFYRVGSDDSLEFYDSYDLGGWGIAGTFSPSDRVLVLTWTPSLLNTLIGGSTLSFSPCTISTLEMQTARLTLQDTAGASPLCFGLEINENDQLLVSCMPTMLQEDTQLFSLE
jgi:hypothetical protein